MSPSDARTGPAARPFATADRSRYCSSISNKRCSNSCRSAASRRWKPKKSSARRKKPRWVRFDQVSCSAAASCRCAASVPSCATSPAPAVGQAAAGDSVVYRLSPVSRLDVKTGKAGLFGFAGHEHLIRARGFSGRVVYFPGAPALSRIEITVRTDSLEVLTPPDTEEIRKVTEAMRTDILKVDQYPEITMR